ncbi:hypothetical protein Godav_018123, partial [Gossypium davidsonii]|nr:hypothetical protein [Gossypium davidsonii]
MWRMLVVLRRNLQNIKKTHRVADENMVNNNNNGGEIPIFINRRRSHGSWN